MDTASKINSLNLRTEILRFKNVRIKGENYAEDKNYAMNPKDGFVYDLELYKSGYLYLIGKIVKDKSSGKIKFNRLHKDPNIEERLNIVINLKKDEEDWAPPHGKGYLLVKQHFEELQKSDKSGGFKSRRHKRSRRNKSRRNKSRRNKSRRVKSLK